MRMPQNSNDVLVKHLSTALPDGVLDVIGVHGVHIERALPTELDSVDVRQEFTDVVWELRNGSILHLEAQTTKPKSLYRFLRYDALLAERFGQNVDTIILYSAAVNNAPDQLDFGCAQYRVRNIFLSSFDGEHVLDAVQRHLSEAAWEAEDRVRLAFAFQMQFASMTKDEAFERILRMTRQIENRGEQDYVTALILGINGKQLSKAQKKRLREVLGMTGIVKEIWHDVLEEGKLEGRLEGKLEGRLEGKLEGKLEAAKAMLEDGLDVVRVSRLTGISIEELERLQEHRQ